MHGGLASCFNKIVEFRGLFLGYDIRDGDGVQTASLWFARSLPFALGQAGSSDKRKKQNERVKRKGILRRIF